MSWGLCGLAEGHVYEQRRLSPRRDLSAYTGRAFFADTFHWKVPSLITPLAGAIGAPAVSGDLFQADFGRYAKRVADIAGQLRAVERVEMQILHPLAQQIVAQFKAQRGG